jgi:hypothetical protein
VEAGDVIGWYCDNHCGGFVRPADFRHRDDRLCFGSCHGYVCVACLPAPFDSDAEGEHRGICELCRDAAAANLDYCLCGLDYCSNPPPLASPSASPAAAPRAEPSAEP